MDIELETTENLQTYDLKLDGECVVGEITNKSVKSGFVYKTDDYPHQLNSDELKAIAKKLDDLNG